MIFIVSSFLSPFLVLINLCTKKAGITKTATGFLTTYDERIIMQCLYLCFSSSFIGYHIFCHSSTKSPFFFVQKNIQFLLDYVSFAIQSKQGIRLLVLFTHGFCLFFIYFNDFLSFSLICFVKIITNQSYKPFLRIKIFV